MGNLKAQGNGKYVYECAANYFLIRKHIFFQVIFQYFFTVNCSDKYVIFRGAGTTLFRVKTSGLDILQSNLEKR